MTIITNLHNNSVPNQLPNRFATLTTLAIRLDSEGMIIKREWWSKKWGVKVSSFTKNYYVLNV